MFEVDLTRLPPTRDAETLGDFTGDMIRHVGVVVTDSNYGKAQEVAESDYDDLPPERRETLPTSGERYREG